MENIILNEWPTLRWVACGPDLTQYEVTWAHERILEFGEIGLRYAIHLVNGIWDFDGERERADTHRYFVDKALKENWLSDVSQEKILDYTLNYMGTHVEIPWQHLYLDELDDAEQATLERLACASSEGIEAVAHELFTANGTKNQRILRLLKPTIQVHPDFRLDTIIKWLEFIVNGHDDPRFRRAYERYQPNKSLPHFDSYRSCFARMWDLDTH